MKQTAILLCILAATVAGCGQAPADKPETKTTTISSPAAGTSSAAANMSLAPLTGALLEYAIEGRKAETPFFKGHETEIARDGNVLTISSGGKPVASLTDNDSYQWLLAGSFQAGDGGNRKTYFLIRQIKLETDATSYNLIVDGEGNPVDWVLDNVRVFDGPILASGLGSSLDMGGPEIDDWTQTPHLRFNFDSACDPEKWLSATTILARCLATESIGSTDSEALITRISATEWQLREKPAAYVAVQKSAASASAAARPVYDERVTGVPIKPLSRKDLESLTSEGFKRLP